MKKDHIGNINLLKNTLKEGKLYKIKEAVNTAANSLPEDEYHREARVYLLRNHTLESLKTFLEAELLINNTKLSFEQGSYNCVQEEILAPGSRLYASNPSIIVVSLCLETMIPDFRLNAFRPEDITSRLEDILHHLAGKAKAPVVINLFLEPEHQICGIHDAAIDSSLYSKIRSINNWLLERGSKNGNLYISDWNQVARRAGSTPAKDFRHGHHSKSFLTNKFLHEYSKDILSVLNPLLGNGKRCIILDCDNTLWSGILGEDGPDGAIVENDGYPGKCFYDFQAVLKQLKNRGILLALATKNNQEDIEEMFQKNADIPLKYSDFIEIKANWENKADNIVEIADSLNLSLSQCIFIDDSGFECDFVKSALPEIEVVQVPKDPSGLVELIESLSFFAMLEQSPEDLERSKIYQDEKSRDKAREKFSTLDEYIKTLEIKLDIQEDDLQKSARIAQLTQKTNQFNLSLKRYSEGNIQERIKSDAHKVFSLSARDKFGDYGLIGVAVFNIKDANRCLLETFLISCRALGRKIEHSFLNECLSNLKKSIPEITQIQVAYVPGKRNQQALDFIQKLGGTESKRNKNGFEYVINI